MRSSSQILYAVEALGLAVAVISIATVLPSYESQIAALTIVFALAGVGQNILVGYAGIVSLGHVVFFAIGAYGWARLSPDSVAAAFLLPIVLSLAVAALIVAVTQRVAGYYFAITTLAIGLLSTVLVRNWTSLTGGFAGIGGIQQLEIPWFSGPGEVLVVAGLTLAVTFYFHASLRDSPLGTAMLAMRFDPAASRALGISTSSIKFIAFMASSVPVTIAGAYLAQLIHYIGPDQFTLLTSIHLIAIPVIGGRGWRWAPVLGAVIVITLPELLRPLAEYRLVFYGAALTFVALFMPRGLSQLAIWVRQWLGSHRRATQHERRALG